MNITPNEVKMNNKLLRDHKNNVSFARASGLACIGFSMLIVIVTLILLKINVPSGNASLIKEFSTSSVYQFLGLAALLYGVSKWQESTSDKAAASIASNQPIAPAPPALAEKAIPLVEKAVEKTEQLLEKKTIDKDEEDTSSGSAKAN